MESLIRLFHAIEVSGMNTSPPTASIARRTIPQGFIFDIRIFGEYDDAHLYHLADEVNRVLGLSGAQMNTSFHKSWNKVATAPIEQLYSEQILHYFTTYGFERLGVFSEDTVFIPKEALNVPAYQGTRLTVIHGLTLSDIKERLLALLTTGVALSKQSVDDATEIARVCNLSHSEVESVRNKEVKLKLYESLGYAPSDPSEFMRFLIYKTTGETLLIKDKKTIEALKKGPDVTPLLELYIKQHGIALLSSVFYRYKPLFLALKHGKDSNRLINRIRKLAVTWHTPMPRDLLNDTTGMLACGNEPDLVEFGKALDKANIFRKIRLAYALRYRMAPSDSIQYKIRNGKSYATEFKFYYPSYACAYFDLVYSTILKDIEPKVKGKRIYIPQGITYALPATEKQFTGNIPSGTSITLPDDAVFGVYWENRKTKENDSWYNRVDLDLAIMDVQAVKYGWDGAYRGWGTNERAAVLFSGDMTDASPSATELFYIAKHTPNTYLMTLNYYNFSEETKIPFKILVGSKPDATPLTRNYMIDPSNVVMIAQTETTHKQKLLGIIKVTPQGTRFIFSEAAIGASITSSGKPYMQQSREYLDSFYSNTISLNQALSDAGAIILTSPANADIDLSPESLTKDTIIALLT